MIQMRNNSQIQGKYICLQRIKPINTTNYKESEDMCSIMEGGGRWHENKWTSHRIMAGDISM